MRNLFEIKADFVESVTNYLAAACRFKGEELALKTSAYLDWNWPAVEASYFAMEPSGTGNVSDFTCEFICRMLSEK